MSASIHSEAESIPVEEDDDDLDSAYGAGYAESTLSLTDSVRDYREICGRTYQNFRGSEYWEAEPEAFWVPSSLIGRRGPNDDKQNDQLDIVHHMLTMLLDGKLFLAPIGPAPQRVLDVGTGTGIWAMDFADQFPSAEVIATDLSDIMPSYVPPNCRFELDDAELEWTFIPASFDFIHMRYLMGAVCDWPRLYGQAYKALKPGGWIEHMELSVLFECDDGSLSEDSPLRQWGPIQLEAGEKMGKSLAVSQHIKDRMIEAGFLDVREIKFKLPVGPWSSDEKMKKIGSWNLFFFLQDTEAFCIYLLGRVMGWEQTSVQAWVGMIKSALRSSKTHTYYRANLVYGRKGQE